MVSHIFFPQFFSHNYWQNPWFPLIRTDPPLRILPWSPTRAAPAAAKALYILHDLGIFRATLLDLDTSNKQMNPNDTLYRWMIINGHGRIFQLPAKPVEKKLQTSWQMNRHCQRRLFNFPGFVPPNAGDFHTQGPVGWVKMWVAEWIWWDLAWHPFWRKFWRKSHSELDHPLSNSKLLECLDPLDHLDPLGAWLLGAVLVTWCLGAWGHFAVPFSTWKTFLSHSWMVSRQNDVYHLWPIFPPNIALWSPIWSHELRNLGRAFVSQSLGPVPCINCSGTCSTILVIFSPQCKSFLFIFSNGLSFRIGSPKNGTNIISLSVIIFPPKNGAMIFFPFPPSLVPCRHPPCISSQIQFMATAVRSNLRRHAEDQRHCELQPRSGAVDRILGSFFFGTENWESFSNMEQLWITFV